MKFNLYKNLVLLALFSLVFIFKVPSAEAATLFMLPTGGEIRVGQTFDLAVRINSEGQGFNSAQATILFPKDTIEVKSVGYSPAESIFNFWLEEPKFSNTEGKITFVGGTANGVVGASVQILKITFFAKGAGQADIVASDAAIIASDGSGTNILSTINIARFTVKPSVAAPSAAPSPVPPPTQITRKPASAERLPGKPVLIVPLYPDPTKWYNISSNFLVSFGLPSDVSSVATAINHDPAYVVPQLSEGLFDAETFGALKDGIWYLHVRFQNSIGWGPSAHYRIAVDTVPPFEFTIESREGFSTDNPAPHLSFQTNDGLSGLDKYRVRIGDGDIIELTDGSFKLPLQAPGKHLVLVTALDKAGNAREASLELEILPVVAPIITFVSQDNFVGEEGIAIAGTAAPNASLVIFIKSKKGAVAAEAAAKTDKNGNWEARVASLLKKGTYFAEVLARDRRGALSLPVHSELFRVRERPILTVAGLGITQFWFFIGLIVILLFGFGAGWFSYRLWREQLGRRVIIAERDVVTAFSLIKNDVDRLLDDFISPAADGRKVAEAKFLLKNIKDHLEKMQKYILENIKEISE